MKLLEKELKTCRTLVFMDLEATQFTHEMIEIGAVKVELKDDLTVKKIHRGFKSYVKAKGSIGKVVTSLTGITQAKLDKEGKPFRTVLINFKKYIGKDWNKCRIVTFGNQDSHIILQSLYNHLEVSAEDARHLVKSNWDFAEFIARFIRDPNGNNYSLTNYLRLFGIEFDGKAHDALADAANLLELYKAFLNGKDVIFENYKVLLSKKVGHLPEPIRKVISKLNNKESVSFQDYEEFIKDYLQ